MRPSETASYALCIAVGLSAITCGDSMKQPPQMIEADGNTFFACGSDTIYITNEGAWFGGETTFRLKFTDANGLSHVIKGVRKLHVSELAKTSTACQRAP